MKEIDRKKLQTNAWDIKKFNIETILSLHELANVIFIPEFIEEPETIELPNFKVQMLLCNGRINFLDG